MNPTDTNVNSCKAVTVVELSSSEGGLPAIAQPHESLSKPSFVIECEPGSSGGHQPKESLPKPAERKRGQAW